MKKIYKIICLLFLSLIALLCCGIAYQFISTKLDNIHYPPPGKLIDIGGYKLHINCSGQGAPSVILDAGMGHFSIDWTLVQPEVAQFAHVCSYDRAGLGWSEESPLIRTSENIVKELHALLHNAKIPQPYILVGHSLGGINMRLYANTYPDEVFGLVLVDSSHELQEEKEKEIDFHFPAEEPRSYLQQIIKWLATSRLGQISGIMRLHLQSVYKDHLTTIPQSIRAARLSRMLSPASWRTNEWAPFVESLKQLEQSKNLLGNKPLTVITAGKAFDPATPEEHCKHQTEFYEKIWQPLQKDLVKKSTRGKQIIAEKSCHMIPYDQPEVIVSAIKEMVNEYKK